MLNTLNTGKVSQTDLKETNMKRQVHKDEIFTLNNKRLSEGTQSNKFNWSASIKERMIDFERKILRHIWCIKVVEQKKLQKSGLSLSLKNIENLE